MTEREARTIYTRDRSSGTIHARLVVDGRTLSDERDNLDDAGEWDEVTKDQAMAAPADERCQRCFPVDGE